MPSDGPRELLRQLTYRVARHTPINTVARYLLRDRLLVVCYHGIAAGPADVPDSTGLHVPVDLFRAQVDLLVRRYVPVSLADVHAHLTGAGELPERALLVTFDDGYRNSVQNGLPVLRERRVPALMFVVPAVLEARRWLWPQRLEWARGTRSDYWPTMLSVQAMDPAQRRRWLEEQLGADEAPPPENDYTLATWEELAQAAALGGLEIGAHGLTHEPLTTCDDRHLGEELEVARRSIARHLGGAVDTVAYPHGDHDGRVVRLAREAGYRLGFTTVHGHVRRGGDPLAIPRVCIGARDEPSVLEGRLAGWLEMVA